MTLALDSLPSYIAAQVWAMLTDDVECPVHWRGSFARRLRRVLSLSEESVDLLTQRLYACT